MKRNLLAGAIAALCFSSLQAGEAVFYISEDGEALKNISVKIDAQKKLVDKNGFISFELKGDIEGGHHKVELTQFGEWAGEFDFTASSEQNAEVQVEMIGGEAVANVALYIPGKDNNQASALGKISGYVESDETGGGVELAIISVVGSPYSTSTDNKGFYQLEMPRGEYTLKIAHPNYGNREVKKMRVLAQVSTQVNINLSMSGEGVIEEVVAVGSYIPSTATAQQRDSSAILNAIGSEQFSRFGDSNAASALKRVAGVTVSGGKYVVSRGLNERHSTIMLNGASLPSPDPSRRVVPLDIFPSSILDGIDVQKSFTPDVYADSTGAAVKLKTKKFPEEFEGKISASLGFVKGLTFKDREVQQSEGGDILGLGATGDRKLPGSFASLNENSAKSPAVASDFANNLGTENKKIAPNTSIELSMGNTLLDSGDVSLGYTTSIKYSNKWNKQDREQNTYDVNNGVLTRDDAYQQERTSNDINLGAGFSLGMIMGNHEYSSNTMLLRQTHTENVVETGVGGDQDRESINYQLGWYERQFFFQQFTGEHFFAELAETEANWQLSISEAKLDAPDERTYSFERDPDEAAEEYVLYWSSLDRVYNELSDNNVDFSIDFSTVVFANDNTQAKAKYGLAMFSRERDADGTTVNYSGNGQTASDYEGNTNIDDVVEGAIETGELGVTVGSRPSDDYDATWDLTSFYLAAEYEMFDNFKISLGARAEDSQMKLNTYTLGSTNDSLVEDNAQVSDDGIFTSASALYYIGEGLQIRGTVYDTINRPDFREISNSFYVDPESGDTYVGNTNLQSSEVDNTDIRLEYYFTDNESLSLAYFTKDFEQPIEKTLKTGGEVRSFENAKTGELSGFEIDFRKEFDFNLMTAFVSGNYAEIDSEVDLIVGSTLRTQAMQGQPKSLSNLQLGIDHLEWGAEFTLLYNHQGESLEAVSIGDEPNVIKQARAQIDFNYSQELADDLQLKVKLKNITDEAVELTQENRIYRKYKKGTELSLGISMPL